GVSRSVQALPGRSSSVMLPPARTSTAGYDGRPSSDSRYDGAVTHDATVSLQAPAPGDDGAYILILDREQSRRVPLPTEGELVVGREDGVGLQLRDPSVSRRHAKVVLSDDEAALVDLGSHNGLEINGERLAENGTRPLRHRDVVVLGRTVLVFYAAA